MHIARHYTFIDKLLPESFQTTVGISRVGMIFSSGRFPTLPPHASTPALMCKQ